MPRIVELTPQATFDLRRLVLRSGDPLVDVEVDGDSDPLSLHLGCRTDRELAACLSLYPSPTPYADATHPFQLRFMAVSPTHQQQGLGSTLVKDAIRRLKEAGCDLLWANARDTALGFYTSLGFAIVSGSENVTTATGLPHTIVLINP